MGIAPIKNLCSNMQTRKSERAIPIIVILSAKEMRCILLKEKKRVILRGDIYYADLSPVVGCEQGGVRPILVLQNNIGNKYSPTLIVAAITGREKKQLPTHVRVNDIHSRPKKSVVLLEQIRTIDRKRLCEWVGTVAEDNLSEIDQALKVSVGL